MTRTYDNGWHSGDTIREDVTNHYNNLVHAHERLHKEIEQCQHDVPDTDLKHLKIKKLRLKDELQRLKTNLVSFGHELERTPRSTLSSGTSNPAHNESGRINDEDIIAYKARHGINETALQLENRINMSNERKNGKE